MGIPLTLSQVPEETPYVQYVSTNGQTVFPYPFAITQDSDLVVVVSGVTLQTDAGYSLSNQGNPTGGNVTFTAGQTTGAIVTLFRDIPIERISQISQNSGFQSVVFNAEFNNIYLLLQQLESSIGLCLQIPNTNSPVPTTVLTPSSYAGKYLSFDANGNPTPAVLTPSGAVTAALIAALLNPVTAAESSLAITPTNYAYLYPGPVYNILRYGAKGDGVTNDSPAMQIAANVASVFGGTVYFPPGYKWGMATQVTVSSQYPVNLIGEMTGNPNETALASYIKPLNNITGSLFAYVSPTGTISQGGAGLIRGLAFMDDSNLGAATPILRRNFTMTAALNLDSFSMGTVENCYFAYIKGSYILNGYVIQSNFSNIKAHYCGDVGKPGWMHQSTGVYQTQNCTHTSLISEVQFSAAHILMASNTQDCKYMGCGFETTQTSDETSPYIQFNGLRNTAVACSFNRRPATGYAIDFNGAARCGAIGCTWDLSAGQAVNFANDRNYIIGGSVTADAATTAPVNMTAGHCKIIGVNFFVCPGFTIAGNFNDVVDCTFDGTLGSGYVVTASGANFGLSGNQIVTPTSGMGGFNLTGDGVCTGNKLSGNGGGGIGINVASANVACAVNELSNWTTNLVPATHLVDSVIENNVGYVRRTEGSNAIADGGTIAHGLPAAPTKVTATGTVAAQIITVTALGSTTFTVAIKTTAGAPGTTQSIYWQAGL